MKKEREIRDYIQDISTQIKLIEQFTENLNYEGFSKDIKSVYAVTRAFEIMGEAVRHLPDSFKNKYPQIPWKKISGIRDKLIHDYFSVDSQIIWETIQLRLPELKSYIQEIKLP